MSVILVLVVTLIGLLQNSVAHITQDGQCQNILLQQDFNAEKFLGKWYEMDWTENPYQTGDCSYIELANTTDNNIEFTFAAVHESSYSSQRGNAIIGSGPAVITLEGSFLPEPIKLQVMQTDYDNYAIVFNCINLSTTQRGLTIWILARDRTQSDSTRSDITRTLLFEAFGVDISTFKAIEHSKDACTILNLNEFKEPVILPGQCNPNIRVVPNLNVSRYMGRWHENFAYLSDHSQNRCSQTRYSQEENGVISVANSQVLEQTLATTSGTVALSPDSSGKLTVQLNLSSGVRTHDLWILDTDYDSYSVAYACVNLENNQRRVYSWILSRSKRLTAEARAAVNEVVEREPDLSFDFYRQTDQSDQACFFNPDLVRGQCDQNIPVIANFNATAYSGIWYDIESYPSIFQTGTCRNGEFGVVNDKITVLNSQVIDRNLRTVNGVATVASNDGSAKLIFNTTIDGTNVTISADYWVLDTDYESYSLVYTCENVNTQESRVRAWKMSRTKQLTSAASTAISNVIRNTTALEERFFQPVDQSDDACFYFPTLDKEDPVMFPGQCDENISVFQNISIERFMGRWHENYAYKSDHSQNLCSHTTYSLDENNVVFVTNNQVLQQTLASTSGSVIRSPDGSGRWTIQLNLSSGVRTHDLWILDTDYDSYAVAYACINLENNRRRVYSWILSRTRQLTAEAKAAADKVVDRELPLTYQYYRQTDQSDQACFFNPDLVSGLCNQNIPVVPNFNSSAYAGVWHDIESYPSNFQRGSCRKAQYTVANDEVVILNSQVMNRELQSVSSVATVVSNDGSAKLEAIFEIPGTNTSIKADYWILDTDYVSYALVYSCYNVNYNESRVNAWKLSRTKALTTEASWNIDETIRNVSSIEERFFQPVDHSDDGCFYMPELDREDPVIFLGQCDENISVKQNISAERFMGRWHENFAYKSDHSQNLCSHTTYRLGENDVISVTNNQVLEQTLTSTSGTVIRSPDGSGKWTVQLNLSSGVRTHDLWILDTDYDSYSVAYACVNLENNRRRVYSWILSRTRQLTAEAKAAADKVVDRELDLSYQYYRQTNQSEQACFFNPENVRGQCNQNIPVVANFNSSAYMGVWHDIESYPSILQTGTCRNAQYSLVNGGIAILNSEVTDQALRSVASTAVLASNDGSAKFKVRFPIEGTDTFITADYWILDTDYTSYSLVYTCANINENESRVRAWKLSRTKQLTPEASSAIDNVVRNVVSIEDRFFQPVDQSDDSCFYLPEQQPGVPMVFPGQCDHTIPVEQDFDLQRYMGRWRLIESYFSSFQSGQCNQASYTLSSDLSLILVENSQVLNQSLATSTGSAPTNFTEGRLQVTMDSTSQTVDYWVLATDYSSYALVYSCSNVNTNERRVLSWKLSRTDSFTPKAVSAMDSVIDSINVLNNRYYTAVDQSDEACFYFPDSDPSTPVEFRGQCDTNITGVQNFNVSRYLGRWYEVERYPHRRQGEGRCNRATYTRGANNSFDIVNAHVVNGGYSSISGSAVTAADGSGNLVVTINRSNGIGRSAPLIVLATDYTDYALLYACTDLTDNRRQVGSWKLSRTPTLSSAGNSAINTVIANTQGLYQEYYTPTRQTERDCVGNIRGRCENISGMQSFDFNRYLGLWHEIERYPLVSNTGECRSTQYQSSENRFRFVDTSVFNLTGHLTTGTVAAGQNGKLTRTLSNGQQQDLWILATDYNSYSLVVTCETVDDENIRVWSAKYSKTRELSQEAETALDSVVATNDMLLAAFYNKVDQSDGTCFHYPEQDGVGIILPGLCDESIPTVRNFNIAAYAGTWYQIERYPYPDVPAEATCIGASYTLDEATNTVAVLNWQVLDDEIQEIKGTATPSSDGSGKLRVELPASGGEATTTAADLYILSTDYESYSLAYTCKNINTFQRSVVAFKLSRTRTMPSAGAAAINAVISQREELHQPFFIPVIHHEDCKEPNSSYFVKSSVILILFCYVLQMSFN